MSNFLSALGEGLMNFGQMRQQRQTMDYERQRQEQLQQQAQAEKDRQYAWDVASNLAPDQDLDDASWSVLSKAGPELGAYVNTDPITGKRKWRGTQQQQTRAAQEKASIEAANRNNAIVAKQQEEIARRDALNKAVGEFTQKTGRRPTRDELYKMGLETGGFEAKDLVSWDLQDQQIKSQEAMQQRYLASANRDNRYTPAGAPKNLDISQLQQLARQRFASGQIDQTEYDRINSELVKVGSLQKNPLQYYMNDLQNDLTEYYNSGQQPGTPPAQWDPDPTKNVIRSPDNINKFLQYIQSDPNWRMQAQADLGDDNNINRYVEFVKQIQDKWQKEQAQRPQQGWADWLPWR